MSADLWAAFGSHQESSRSQVKETPSNTIGSQSKSELTRGHDERGVESFADNSGEEAGEDRWETDSWSAVNEALENAWQNPEKSHSIAPSAAKSVSLPHPTNEDEDDFGEFEDPVEAKQAATVAAAGPNNPLPPTNPDSQAIEADNEDDFGDFADVEPEGEGPATIPTANDPGRPENLSSTTTQKPFQETKQRSKSNQGGTIDFNALISGISQEDDATAGPAGSRGPFTPYKDHPVLYAESDSDGNADDWDDFEAKPQVPIARAVPTKPLSRPPPSKKLLNRDPTKTGTSSKRPSATNRPPPLNLPPPSILMSLVTYLIPKLPDTIRISIVETFEEDEADVKKHRQTLVVGARIIAGRKLRWKRDTNLAQSMSIGMSGRQGGMKLAGVDRAEVQREDREAAELVRVWRQHLGSIRTALAEAVSTSEGRPAPLPAITEAAAIRTVTAEDGGIKAPKCCVLCGLKRDERADKVDREVWDQFGEWWTDHWGHTECKSFWEQHNSLLQQR